VWLQRVAASAAAACRGRGGLSSRESSALVASAVTKHPPHVSGVGIKLQCERAHAGTGSAFVRPPAHTQRLCTYAVVRRHSPGESHGHRRAHATATVQCSALSCATRSSNSACVGACPCRPASASLLGPAPKKARHHRSSARLLRLEQLESIVQQAAVSAPNPPLQPRVPWPPLLGALLRRCSCAHAHAPCTRARRRQHAALVRVRTAGGPSSWRPATADLLAAMWQGPDPKHSTQHHEGRGRALHGMPKGGMARVRAPPCNWRAARSRPGCITPPAALQLLCGPTRCACKRHGTPGMASACQRRPCTRAGRALPAARSAPAPMRCRASRAVKIKFPPWRNPR
jgi:hypothetical protein